MSKRLLGGAGGGGGGGGEDQLLFEEKDEQFWLSVGKSLSGRFLFADSGSTETRYTQPTPGSETRVQPI